jgi:hypothetical protein
VAAHVHGSDFHLNVRNIENKLETTFLLQNLKEETIIKTWVLTGG